jgi:predicted lipoprotein with Yx(FWY)xxD motif
MRAGIAAIASSLVLAACSAGSGTSSAPSVAPSTAPPSEAAAGTIIQVATSPLGQILTDGDGNTVYLFTPDSPNVSTCAAGCIDTWPPVVVEDGDAPQAGAGVTATLGTITRDDGTVQITVNELPIYYFAGDLAPGDTNGQNVGAKWFVVDADGSMNQGSAASTTSTYRRDGY